MESNTDVVVNVTLKNGTVTEVKLDELRDFLYKNEGFIRIKHKSMRSRCSEVE